MKVCSYLCDRAVDEYIDMTGSKRKERDGAIFFGFGKIETGWASSVTVINSSLTFQPLVKDYPTIISIQSATKSQLGTPTNYGQWF